ncbi:MAG: glycosyltransferase [Methylohalobius sp. ZOD2]
MGRKYSLKLIKQHLSKGDVSSAKNLLRDALHDHPDFFLYHEYLGDILRQEGNEKDAQPHYSRALELKPDARWITHKIKRDSSCPKLPSNQMKFCGIYDFYPDDTGKRKAEGGLRIQNRFKSSRPGEPLVTIVTAVYDNASTFQRCIDSVKAQTYSNVEYIVIDGGSPQSTLDILKKNEEMIDYYISEPDSGIYSAMNKGIRLARGDYICLLNSDDFYDPDFVSETVKAAAKTNADIIYTDFHLSNKALIAQKMGPGVLFGHLNICHNTFLTNYTCYNRIGPYREDLRIVSDAVWIREAFQKGVHFHRIRRSLFTLSEGGLSSGSSEDRRKLFIREVIESYRTNFPELTESETEEIYLLRFNKNRSAAVAAIAQRHLESNHMMKSALKEYVEYCFGARDNFRLDHSEANSIFPAMIDLANIVGADPKTIRIDTKHGHFPDILEKIDHLIALRKVNPRKTILHFVTVFSAPSETFIYDLVKRLDTKTGYDNFVLFEYAKLREERPFKKALQVPWHDLQPEVAKQIYHYFLTKLKPDVIVAHFAINEHRLQQRIRPLGIRIPTVVMTHGIDVFNLKQPSEYTDYVLGDLAKRNDVAFTAVSDYLRSALVNAGMAENKITVIPNTVNERFYRHRKTKDFYDGSRPLRLLCIGRMIALKGHRYLIEALAQFKARCTDQFELTLVYGNGSDELESLHQQIKELDLESHVKFEPFVNFEEHPGFHSKFDCYIHPSVYSDDALQRSESFGVAPLEAIAAGLPVITTDAGGLPEVLDRNTPHSRIVPHGDSKAICTALTEFCKGRDAFTDNLAYAKERLAIFSEQRQITSLSQVIERVCGTKIKAALFSTMTHSGAGYAAMRLHRGLVNTSISSTLYTTTCNHANETGVNIIKHPSGDNRNWYAPNRKPKPGYTIFTFNKTSIPSEELIQMVEDYDVINLHWYARFLSVENIATLTRLGKPVVITIRDMYPLTGGCHVFHGCDRWLDTCANCPQIPSSHTEYPSKILRAKRENYNFSNLTIVTLSKHTRSIVEKTPYFKDCRIETIPNSIETNIFRPYNKIKVRKEFGLPQDRKIIGYFPSYSSEVKGYREATEAFRILQSNNGGEPPFVMLVGNETPATKAISLDKKVMGYIADNNKLAQIYSAADVVVVPSLEETFSNTTAEAISCGVPVVGFRTGAIPDLAIDGKTGYTYEIGDVVGLADGLRRVLTGPDMRAICRAHAESTLSFMIQAHRYEVLFHELVANNIAIERTKGQPHIINFLSNPTHDLLNIAGEI